jgi:hypothetical protein
MACDPAGDSGDSGAQVTTGQWRSSLAVEQPSEAGVKSVAAEELDYKSCNLFWICLVNIRPLP